MSERPESPDRTTPSDDPTTSLSHYLAPLRDHRNVVLLVTLVTVAVGFLVAVAGPRSYTATSSVLVYPVSADPTEALQSTDRSDDMATELRIAESRTVAEMAATELGELGIEVSPRDAASNISVTNPEDSRILNVSYRSSDAAVARVGSELATSAYLAYRSELNASSRQVARDAINDEISVLQDRLTDVEERLEQAAAGSSASLVVEVEKTSIEGELEAQQRALADLSTLSIDAATVFDTAQEPSSADGLGGPQILIGSVAGGLVLGVIAAWILAALNIEVNTERLPKIEKPSRRIRRPEGEGEGDGDGTEDVDSPFDDSDNRDPLQLLKELDAVESDPRIALAAASAKRREAEEASTVEEDEPVEDQEPSFAEMYPNDFFDDGAATDLGDEAAAPEDDESVLDTEFAAEVEPVTEPDGGFEPNVENQVVAPFETTEPGEPVATETNVETSEPAEPVAIDTHVETTEPAEPVATDTHVETDDPFVSTGLADPVQVEVEIDEDPAPAEPGSRPAVALRGLASLNVIPALDQLPPLTSPTDSVGVTVDEINEIDGELLAELTTTADVPTGPIATADVPAVDSAGDEGGPAFDGASPIADPFGAAYDAAEVGLEYEPGDDTGDPELLAADGDHDHGHDHNHDQGRGQGQDQQTDDAVELADASPTSGDPNELDPGPPSWDGPFVGPTTWEQLSAMAAAANDLTASSVDARDSTAEANRPEAEAQANHPEADQPETQPEAQATQPEADQPEPEPEAEVQVEAETAVEIAEPAKADLVAGNDIDTLFEQIGQLGTAGPVAILSLSDRNPAAGLTAGFELADELRAVGAHVLLIDARIDDPVLDTLFEGGPGAGLAQVMTGQVVLDQAVRSLSGLDGLDLLTAGTVDGETAGHLTGASFDRLLSEARLNYHSIVIIGDRVTAAEPSDTVDIDRCRAMAAAVDGLIVGTNDPVGTVARTELTSLLASFDAPTLQLVTAPVAPADDTAQQASSV